MKPLGYYIGYYGFYAAMAVLLVSAIYAIGKTIYRWITRR